MAFISKDLILVDRMSPALKQLYQTMKPALEAIEQMQSAIDQLGKPTGFNEVRNHVADLTQMLENITLELTLTANDEKLTQVQTKIKLIIEGLETISDVDIGVSIETSQLTLLRDQLNQLVSVINLSFQTDTTLLDSAKEDLQSLFMIKSQFDQLLEIQVNAKQIDAVRTNLEQLNEHTTEIEIVADSSNLDLVVAQMDTVANMEFNLDLETKALEEAQHQLVQMTNETINPVVVIDDTPLAQTIEKIAWIETDIPVVFQSEGFERLQQESNDVLNRLSQIVNGQRDILTVSSNMELLPVSAQKDIGDVTLKMRELRNDFIHLDMQMNETMDSSKVEPLNRAYEQIRGELADLSMAQKDFNQALESGDASAIQQTFERLNQDVIGAQRQMRAVNDELKNGQNEANLFSSILEKGFGMVKEQAFKLLKQGVQVVVKLSDEWGKTQAQIQMMNDGMQSSDELQQIIMQSAHQTRSDYFEVA